MKEDRKRQLKEFEDLIEIQFNSKKYLDLALTHSSYANQFNLKYEEHNERLEFLGDSVLSMVISEYIFKNYQKEHEGRLTKIRAGVVCEASLAKISRKLNINNYIRIGKGEELSGGRNKDSLLADACEALIAAIYLDKGYEIVRGFVLENLLDMIKRLEKEKNFDDYKTKLQEYVQKEICLPIEYKIVNESGPDHDKLFSSEVYIDRKCFGWGNGKSKKEAEQHAAKEALIRLGVNDNEG